MFGEANVFRVLLKGSIVSVAADFLLAALLACVCSFVEPETAVCETGIFIMLALATAVGGFAGGRSCGRGGLVIGGLIGIAVFLILLIVSLAVNGGISIDGNFTSTMLSTAAAGMLGGIIGINMNRD